MPCDSRLFSPLFLHRALTSKAAPLITKRTAAMATSAACIQVKDQIDLTATEKKIFDTLLKTIRHFNLETQTQLRVAGGWVRDNLLGEECNDIDIAIDNMLGSQFVEKVEEYLKSIGEAPPRGFVVIQKKPNHSKHLETAKMQLFGFCMDFVNLRSEAYCESNRIPTEMKFGTPQEDACRRDLTINSLFYNINTNLIEDFTERGFEDLKFRRIVTPPSGKKLSPNPKATFLDDPLRVLRAIRIGARLDFTLDEELKRAASSDEVKKALGSSAKVSKERIGIEIELMISGNRPVTAVNHICDLTLFWVFFQLPNSNVEPAVSEDFCRLSSAYLDDTLKLIDKPSGCISFDGEHRRLCLYSALFLPLRSATYKEYHRKANKRNPVVEYIIKESLKLKDSDAKTVVNVQKSMGKFLSLIPALILSNGEDIRVIEEVEWGTEYVDVSVSSKLLRILAGFLLREIKGFWRVALLMSTLVYPTDKPKEEIFVSVENAILKLGLDKVWDLKPVVNGEDIMEVLHLNVGQPLIGVWKKKVVMWQLAHPSGTAEECRDWMRNISSVKYCTGLLSSDNYLPSFGCLGAECSLHKTIERRNLLPISS